MIKTLYIYDALEFPDKSRYKGQKLFAIGVKDNPNSLENFINRYKTAIDTVKTLPEVCNWNYPEEKKHHTLQPAIIQFK